MPKTREGVIDAKPVAPSGTDIRTEDTLPQRQAAESQAESANTATDRLKPIEELSDPFGKNIENEVLFKHRQLEELQPLVRACIAAQGMSLITGPAGSGKTTAVRSVTDELPSNKYSVIYLGQDQDGTNVLTRFVSCLGIQPRRYRRNLAMQISQWLIDNFDSSGKEIVLVVDEAHLLDNTMLEDFRLMTNANYDRQSPLTLILLGQPLLRLRLKSSDFEALRQRLRYRYCLEGLDQDETVRYIQHRLSSAGLSPDLFSTDALQFIFQITEGLPRRINNVCSLALLRAATMQRPIIDLAFLKQLVDLD